MGVTEYSNCHDESQFEASCFVYLNVIVITIIKFICNYVDKYVDIG